MLSATVIICTRNRYDDLREAVVSIKKQDWPRFDILVVDNGDDPRIEGLANSLGVRYVRAPDKPNLPYARNIGIRNSRGDVVVYCDDDIVAYDGWLRALMETYGEDVGGVGGASDIRPDAGLMEQELASAHGLKGALLKLLAWLLDYRGAGKVTATGQVTGFAGLDALTEVDHLQGCNMSFRRKLLEKAGGFDEFLGLGYPFRDDTDGSWRVKQLGFKLLYQPRARVFHKLAKTDPKFYRRNYYYRNMEHIWFVFSNGFPRGPLGWLRFIVQQSTELLVYFGLSVREFNRFVFTSTVRGKLAGFRLIWREHHNLAARRARLA
jgi:glycosyltransferase involved in cell wall biosynthesis